MTVNALESIEGFRDKWPFAARYVRVNGWRMHYVDEGAGDPNPTWGFLYRDVIPPLVKSGRRRPTPSRLRPHAPRALRCRDDLVADRSLSGLTIPEVATLRARGTAT